MHGGRSAASTCVEDLALVIDDTNVALATLGPRDIDSTSEGAA